MNLIILGLLFDIIGVFNAIINYPQIYGQPLNKTYWGWRPIFKVRPPNEKAKWRFKWNHKVVVYGAIPLKYKGDIIGFGTILLGFILQLKFYLNPV